MKFAYDGRDFYGFARQPNLRTVEGEIINKLEKEGIIKNPKKSIFRAASRTDKHVSALGNVIAFNTDVSADETLEKLSDGSDDILFYSSKEVSSDFYPRYAKLRHYRYYLNAVDLDEEKMIQTLSLFTGEHDFSNFARIEPGKNPYRSIDNIIYFLDDDFLVVDFFAQTFLWHQIRRIISSLVKVGSGKIDIKDVKDALEKPDKRKDFGMALPDFLVLINVGYDFDFDYSEGVGKMLDDFEKKILL